MRLLRAGVSLSSGSFRVTARPFSPAGRTFYDAASYMRVVRPVRRWTAACVGSPSVGTSNTMRTSLGLDVAVSVGAAGCAICNQQ